MKRKIFSLFLCVFLCVPLAAYSVAAVNPGENTEIEDGKIEPLPPDVKMCIPTECSPQISYHTAISLEKFCVSGRDDCYYGQYKVQSCSRCEDGYELSMRKTHLTGCDDDITYWACKQKATIKVCETQSAENCDGHPALNDLDACTETRSYCYGENKVATCTACEDGYELVVDKLKIDGCLYPYERSICKKIQCKNGWYLNKTKSGCLPCPGKIADYGDDGKLPNGFAQGILVGSCGLNTDSTRDGIQGCYYESMPRKLNAEPCPYEDDSGYFDYDADCYYQDLSSGISGEFNK